MRFLLISLFLILVSCKSYPIKSGFTQPVKDNFSVINPYFSSKDKDYVYKASITINDKSFGGIFIVKKIAPKTHRIVFTTEMGSKIFDFSFFDNVFKVNYILEELDKKLLINILRKDFTILVKEHIQAKEKFTQLASILYSTSIVGKKVYYNYNNNQLISIHRVGGLNNKEKVLILFSNKERLSAKNIQILHNNIPLSINLKAIN